MMVPRTTQWMTWLMLLVSPARLNLQERGSSKQGTVQATLLRNKADGDNMFRSERWPLLWLWGCKVWHATWHQLGGCIAIQPEIKRLWKRAVQYNEINTEDVQTVQANETWHTTKHIPHIERDMGVTWHTLATDFITMYIYPWTHLVKDVS